MRYGITLIFTLILVLGGFQLHAETIATTAKDSRLSFAGEHAGRAFTGVFTQWQATLVLPPDTTPSVSASFDLTSADTNNALYNETLLEEDWFNADKFPKASFSSTKITAKGKQFEVIGTLNLRGVSQPVTLFLKPNNNGFTAEFNIDRLAFAIGKESDPDAEWVSKIIKMQLDIKR